MKSTSAIAVFDAAGARLLLCRHQKDPYRGLFDFVVGKCEKDENALACAYRSLQAETGLTQEDIELTHVMDFAYPTTGWCVQVFSGRLQEKRHTPCSDDAWQWVSVDADFTDESLYAGEGYIHHVLSHMKLQQSTPEP